MSAVRSEEAAASRLAMQIIHRPLMAVDSNRPVLRIPVDRLTLAKRRWRGVAEDGKEFGFDLEAALGDGAAVFQGDAGVYVLAQKYEPVLEVRVADCGIRAAGDAARLGWMIGNLHFQIEIVDGLVRVVDDPAVRQLFAREGIGFTACKRIFRPLSGGHHH